MVSQKSGSFNFLGFLYARPIVAFGNKRPGNHKFIYPFLHKKYQIEKHCKTLHLLTKTKDLTWEQNKVKYLNLLL